jgi:MFS superfamily sulfate permease-like transporter
MTIFIKTILVIYSFLVSPFITFAADIDGPIDNVVSLLGKKGNNSGSTIVILLITLAVVIFLFNLIKYIYSEDEGKRKEALSVITYGLVIIFVMVSVWGFVRLLRGTLSLGDTDPKIKSGSPKSVSDLIRK